MQHQIDIITRYTFNISIFSLHIHNKAFLAPACLTNVWHFMYLRVWKNFNQFFLAKRAGNPFPILKFFNFCFSIPHRNVHKFREVPSRHFLYYFCHAHSVFFFPSLCLNWHFSISVILHRSCFIPCPWRNNSH